MLIKLEKDKRAFLDMEVLTSQGFIILFIFAVVATLLGYIISKRMDMMSLPTWQLVVLIIVEFFGAYFFASRG